MLRKPTRAKPLSAGTMRIIPPLRMALWSSLRGRNSIDTPLYSSGRAIKHNSRWDATSAARPGASGTVGFPGPSCFERAQTRCPVSKPKVQPIYKPSIKFSTRHYLPAWAGDCLGRRNLADSRLPFALELTTPIPLYLENSTSKDCTRRKICPNKIPRSVTRTLKAISRPWLGYSPRRP